MGKKGKDRDVKSSLGAEALAHTETVEPGINRGLRQQEMEIQQIKGQVKQEMNGLQQ